MAEFDEKRHRLTIKLVYYGPALSGKTTNLVRLHDLLSPQLTGEMMTLETQGDRTLFFDLLPFGLTAPSGLRIVFKLFTVPGQVAHNGTRKAVLSRADGVLFVADSQCNQTVNNAMSFDNLLSNAATLGLDFDTLPIVVQFNKRDLPDILSEDEIAERWAQTRFPVSYASAMAGIGVVESFSMLLSGVYHNLDKTYHLGAFHGLTRERLLVDTGAGA